MNQGIQMRAKKNVLISGWYGRNNAGDELLLDMFLHKNTHHDITVLTRGLIAQQKAKSIYHCDVLRFDSGGIKQWLQGKPFTIIRALIKCDVFVLGGGGIIRETGSISNLNRLLDEVLIARFLRKKIFIYGVSIGPIKTEKAFDKIKNALHKCDYITVRDYKSMEYLREFGIDESKYSVIPDPAFIKMTTSSKPLSSQLTQSLVNDKKIPIFLALGLIKDGSDMSWLQPLANTLDKLAKDHDVSFIALPFRRISDDHVDDVYCARELQKKLSVRENIECYSNALDHDDLREVMKLSNGVITIRLHAMILAIAEQTPFVAINYDTKVQDTASIAGLEDQVVELNDNFELNLYSLASKLILDGKSLKNKIKVSSIEMSQKAEQTFVCFDKVIESIS